MIITMQLGNKLNKHMFIIVCFIKINDNDINDNNNDNDNSNRRGVVHYKLIN